jgi:hypothetical protein
MKITQNISIALQNTTNDTISGKRAVRMLKLSTTVILSGKEIVTSRQVVYAEVHSKMNMVIMNATNKMQLYRLIYYS